MLLRGLCGSHADLLLMVQKSLTGSQQHVVHARLDFLCKRSVTAYAEFQVRTVVAHHIYLCGRQLIAVLLIHPAFHGLYDLRIVEAVDVVVAALVATTGTEESLITLALERHAEVITLGVEREAGVV